MVGKCVSKENPKSDWDLGLRVCQKFTAESEKGQKNLEEAHSRFGELEQKLEEMKDSKESEEQ